MELASGRFFISASYFSILSGTRCLGGLCIRWGPLAESVACALLRASQVALVAVRGGGGRGGGGRDAGAGGWAEHVALI